MSVLNDPKHVRVWPQKSGSRPVVHETPVAESAPVADVSMESIVNNVFSDDSMKVAQAEEENVSGDLTLNNIWRHRFAHPIALILLLLDRYGKEYLDWEIETLRLTMSRDSTPVSNTVWNKICAGRVVLASPSPWRQWTVYHWVSRALCGESPNFVYMEMPQISHLLFGYEVMRATDPKRITSTEVDKFVAAAFKNEGCPYIPDPLSFAQRELEERKIRCTDCEAVHRDDNDQTCLSCGSKRLERVPYEFEELRTECRRLFDARKGLPLADAVEGLPKTAAGEVVYGLLVDWGFAKTMKQRLVEQLRMIGGK